MRTSGTQRQRGLARGTGLLLALTVLAGIAAGIGGYTVVYADALSYMSSDPKVCANCHIMNSQFESWQKSSHHAAAGCVDGADAVEVPADVDDDAGADDLAGKRGAGGARDQAGVVTVGERDEFADVRLRARQGDRQRHFLVFGGVGRVERAQYGIEMQFAREPGGQQAEIVPGDGFRVGTGRSGAHAFKPTR